jgi:hypothetical protein
MSLIALFTWITTASLGLYLLSIWLIEYDKDFQADAETRLPPLVLVAHVALGGGGLIVWAYYLFFDNDDLAWIATGAVLLGASLGTFMAFRWFAVYQAKRKLQRLEGITRAWHRGSVAVLDRPDAPPADSPRAGPPERNFPLPVVVAHGLFATATITLVVLTAAGVGGS